MSKLLKGTLLLMVLLLTSNCSTTNVFDCNGDSSIRAGCPREGAEIKVSKGWTDASKAVWMIMTGRAMIGASN